MDRKQTGLLCFLLSVVVACMSKDEEIDVELSPVGASIDKCPEVADVVKGMPQILNHLVRKACNSMVFTLSGMGRRAKGDCRKTSFQSQCSASKNSSTILECSVTARNLKFKCADHANPLTAMEAKLINEHFINQIHMDVVVKQEKETIIRIVDVTSLEADMSAMKGIADLSEAVLYRAIFSGLKAAGGKVACSLA